MNLKNTVENCHDADDSYPVIKSSASKKPLWSFYQYALVDGNQSLNVLQFQIQFEKETVFRRDRYAKFVDVGNKCN